MQPSPTDKLTKTLNELRVHQVELEAQNQELKETRKNLEQAVESYFSLFEYAPIGYITHDSRWKIISANVALTKILQLEKSIIIGSRMSSFLTKKDLPVFFAFTKQCRETKSQNHIDLHIKLRRTTMPVQLSTVCVSDKHPTGLYHTAVIDITARKRLANVMEKTHRLLEKKVALRTQELTENLVTLKKEITKSQKLEEQLIQSQRMESLGLLAGGVAHDFNNLLTVILGYGHKLQSNLPPSNKLLQESIDQVLEGAGRAAELTKSLLALSRKQTLNQKTVSIENLIRYVTKFIQRIIGENIKFQISLPKNKLYILADAIQIEQVLINLFTNARDGMPKGGELSIFVKMKIIKEGEEKRFDLPKSGQYVLISVADSGVGIGRKSLARIFEPFYTTKEVGKGSGLGLSIAYGIIKQHDGAILVKSRVNKGTTFNIYLPLANNIPIKTITPESAVIIKGTETLLVVEDEKIVRIFLKKILDEAGYKTIVAKDGDEALAWFKKQNNISLVLSDIIMPKLNGRVMLKEMLKINPKIKAIFISGYTADIMKNRLFSEKRVVFIPKPFVERDLLKKVRNLLDA